MSLERSIIMACGLPGSGKTETTKWLAEQMEYTWCSQDDIRQELKQKKYDHRLNPKVRRILNGRVVESLSNDKNVIIDRGYGEARGREALYRRVDQYKPSIILLEFFCSAEIAKARMQKRKSIRGRFAPANQPRIYSEEIHRWQEPRRDLETHTLLSYLQYDTEHSHIKEIKVQPAVRQIVTDIEKKIGEYCTANNYGLLIVYPQKDYTPKDFKP